MKNRIASVLLAVMLGLSMGLIGCGGEQVQEYSLTISSTEGGDITAPVNDTFSYEGGTEVALVALPHTGYRFKNWTGDVDTVADVNAASTTITMNDNYSITANFIAQYILTIDSMDGGAVTDPGEGTFTYDDGTTVVLEASPEIGYRFVNWSGDVGTISDVNAAATTMTIHTDCTITASFEEDMVVTFVDPNLEAVVRQAIGILERPVYARDMEQLTELDASWVRISDISGLEYATGLTRLDLSTNQLISDITPVANLTKLTELSITNCPLTDITPVANLTDLTEINFQGNQIGDLSPLANLINLEGLWLDSNEISDVSPLGSLANLARLNLWYNEISDLSVLMNLTKLTLLYVPINSMSDIPFVTSLPNLTSLGLAVGQISDAELTELADLSNLIIGLSIGANQITDISPLANLTRLFWLNLGGNYISDVSPLANLANLGLLDLGGNRISDISSLANLTNLQNLYLSSNRISDVSTLANITSLTHIDLTNNQVTDISPLAGLTDLVFVCLGSNRVSDISALASLANLHLLHLESNQIRDISGLVLNEGLGVGNQIGLQGNPLNSDAINIYIPELEARGVIIDY